MKREWLIEFRKSKGLKQEQVASDAFIDRGYYSQIETGKRNPSLNIAVNIARVLDFDPLIFFKENLNNHSLESNSSNHEISKHFESLNAGKILYLYNSEDHYFQNAVMFLVTGIKKGSYCLIIDNHKKFVKIKNNLEAILPKSKIINSTHYINIEELNQLESNNLIRFQQKFKDVESVRIWISDVRPDLDDEILTIRNKLNLKVNIDTLFIRSYNASMISAEFHLNMMKDYPYIMTDTEIVDSPFYDFNR